MKVKRSAPDSSGGRYIFGRARLLCASQILDLKLLEISPSLCVFFGLYSFRSPLLLVIQHSETVFYDLFTGPVFGAQRISAKSSLKP
jgi:hypothetical protein